MAQNLPKKSKTFINIQFTQLQIQFFLNQLIKMKLVELVNDFMILNLQIPVAFQSVI